MSITKKVASLPISNTEKQFAKYLIQGSFDDLWVPADSTKISKYYTDDFIIFEQGNIWDNSRIKQYMREKLLRTGRPKIIKKMEYISAEKYGESMQVTYWIDADFIKEDSIVKTAQWLESAIAVSTPKGWKLKMKHSTKVMNK